MKKLTMLLVTVIFIFNACTTEDKVDTQVDVEAVRNVSINIVEAWNEGDYEGFMNSIDGNAILLPQNATNIVGIDSIKSLYSNSFKNFTFIVNETIKEITVSGDYGYVLGDWKGSMNPIDGSDPVKFNNKILAIYKKQPEGSWLLFRMMYSSNEIPQEQVSPELTD